MAITYEYDDQPVNGRRAPAGEARPPRDAVEFETNVPVKVAIKFSEPRKVNGRWGERCMYTLVDGRVMFVDREVAASITVMEIQVREPFWICRRAAAGGKKGRWDVWLDIEAERARAKREAPAVAAEMRRSIGEASEQRRGGLAGSPVPAPAASPEAAPAPATAGGVPVSQSHHSGIDPGWAQFVISQVNALTDVYAAALSYAREKHGEAVKPEDVRTFVVSVAGARGR